MKLVQITDELEARRAMLQDLIGRPLKWWEEEVVRLRDLVDVLSDTRRYPVSIESEKTKRLRAEFEASQAHDLVIAEVKKMIPKLTEINPDKVFRNGNSGNLHSTGCETVRGEEMGCSCIFGELRALLTKRS